MKRILIVLIMVMTISCLYGLTILDSRLFAVNTHIDNFCLVTLTPLSETLLEGMPFDIAASDVQYDANGTGRRIAEWSLEANMSNYNLSFNALPMTSTTDPSVQLGYILKFKYLENTTEKLFTVSVTSDGTVTSSGMPSSALISTHQDVLFMFDADSTNEIASAPAGSYLGSLTVTLTEN